MKTKKIPMRMCTGCGEMFDKRELVRVVKSPEGEVSLDLTGKKAGRGAYVCKNAECLKKARKHKQNDLYSPIEQVSGRVKSLPSILEKMQRKHIPMDKMEEEIENA